MPNKFTLTSTQTNSLRAGYTVELALPLTVGEVPLLDVPPAELLKSARAMLPGWESCIVSSEYADLPVRANHDREGLGATLGSIICEGDTLRHKRGPQWVVPALLVVLCQGDPGTARYRTNPKTHRPKWPGSFIAQEAHHAERT